MPVKGNVAAIQPSPAFDINPMGHTSGFQWGIDFDYMIQRPTDGKPLIFGGRDLLHARSLAGVIGDTDDSNITPEIQEGLKDFPIKYMKDWGPDVSVRHAWSGIMGFTADELPFVGQVPGLPGQYVAAGYTGHGKPFFSSLLTNASNQGIGMARVFLVIKALMQLAYGEPVDARVPAPFFDIQQRLEKKDEAWERFLAEAYGFDLNK